MADKEIAESKLEQAQKKFKDIPTAEAYLEDCKIRFESISDMAKTGIKAAFEIYLIYSIRREMFLLDFLVEGTFRIITFL